MAKKKKASCLGCLGTIVLAITIIMIIGKMPDEPSDSSQNDQGQTTTEPEQQGTINQRAIIAKVRATFMARVVGVRLDTWQFGPLNDGVAILAGKDYAAYWLDPNGKLHAANGFAMQLSPKIPVAPVGVDYDSVKAAVEKR